MIQNIEQDLNHYIVYIYRHIICIHNINKLMKKEKDYFVHSTVKGKRPSRQDQKKQNIVRLDERLGQFKPRRKQGHIRPDELRQKVMNPKSYPHCCIGLLKFKFKQEMRVSHYGTGVLIGPNIVLTCAHNCYDQQFKIKALLDSMFFYPGLERETGRSYKVKSYFYPPEYEQYQKIEDDFAILILEEEIETIYGSLGLDFSIENKSKGMGSLFGYPAQVLGEDIGRTRDVLGQMYGMKGNWEVDGEIISYEISTTEGQSGSAIYIEKNGEYYIIGIHSEQGEPQQGTNYFRNNKGVLLSNRVKEMINGWIPKTLELNLSKKENGQTDNEINEIISNPSTDLYLKEEVYSCGRNIGNKGVLKICETHRKISKLSISRDCISRLPQQISNLNYLMSLCVVGNQLTELPEELYQLPYLQTIWLSENKIEQLSTKIKQLKNLQQLAIDSNNLRQLPEQLFKLPKLLTLSVCKNKLENLPLNIHEAQRLMQLNISGNKLSSLPQKIVELKCLRQFEYNDNPLNLPQKMKPFLEKFD